MNVIRVIKLEPGKEPVFLTIEEHFQKFREVVGGYWDLVNLGMGFTMICHDNFIAENLPFNFVLVRGTARDRICGTVLFTHVDDTDPTVFRSLTDDEANMIMAFVMNSPRMEL